MDHGFFTPLSGNGAMAPVARDASARAHPMCDALRRQGAPAA